MHIQNIAKHFFKAVLIVVISLLVRLDCPQGLSAHISDSIYDRADILQLSSAAFNQAALSPQSQQQ